MATGVVMRTDAVRPASVRVLGYTDVLVGHDTATPAGLTRLTPGLRADVEPEEPEMELLVAVLLAQWHRADLLVWPVMWSTFADCVGVAAITIVPKEVDLMVSAGALDAAAPVLERVFASQM